MQKILLERGWLPPQLSPNKFEWIVCMHGIHFLKKVVRGPCVTKLTNLDRLFPACQYVFLQVLRQQRELRQQKEVMFKTVFQLKTLVSKDLWVLERFTFFIGA